MGTNYYLYEKDKQYICHECQQHVDRPRHIGKSSAGWCFSLHVIPEESINSLDDWLKLFNCDGAYIKNEYGGDVTFEEMIEIITKREWRRCNVYPSRFYKTHEEMLMKNSAIDGPKGLLRHKIDGVHCVGYGPGTYDYITGEFS